MTLLLVGIVAVILVILAAAFLTLRRGQDDDQDEPGGRWAVRDRVRSAGRDGHWRGQAQDLRAPGRPERADPSRRSEERSRGFDDAVPGYADRRAGRSPRDQASDRGYPARTPGRYADAAATAVYPAPGGRGTRGPGTAPRGPAGRRQDSYDTGPREQLYDTGPSAAMDDHPSLPGGRGFPVEDDDPLTNSDVFPRIRDDIPPAKASKPPAPAKSRSRQSRASKRGDDDDWPSTEWDKLSDEQYWAELSSDKPLATTARTAQPAAAKAATAAASPPPAKPAPAKPGPARAPAVSQGRPASAPAPDRESVAPRRRDRNQDAVTEALPVRNRQRPTAAQPAQPRDAGEPSLAVLTSLASTPPARRPGPAPRDDDPLTSPSFSRQAAPTQDSRSYRNAGRDRPRGNTGDYPTGDYPTGDYPTGDYPTGDYPTAGYQAGGYANANGNYGNGNGNGNGNYANGTRANSNGGQGYQASAGERANPQAAAPAASWPGGHRSAPQPVPPPTPQPVPPQPASPRAPAGNPYGSYVNNAPAAGHSAAYAADDRTRTDIAYGGGYPAATGYPEPPFRQATGPGPAVGLSGQDTGWHSAPPPATPDYPTDPASHYLYTGGSGYPDTAAYGTGSPADASYQNGYPEQRSYPESTGYPEPTGYPESAPYPDPAGYAEGSQNGARYADGYGADPYGPDGYGGYRPRQA